MDCCQRSERARRMLEELKLILYWAEHFRDCLTTSDVEVQRKRRHEIMDGIIALRRLCEVAAPRSGSSLCPMAQFFGSRPATFRDDNSHRKKQSKHCQDQYDWDGWGGLYEAKNLRSCGGKPQKEAFWS